MDNQIGQRASHSQYFGWWSTREGSLDKAVEITGDNLFIPETLWTTSQGFTVHRWSMDYWLENTPLDKGCRLKY